MTTYLMTPITAAVNEDAGTITFTITRTGNMPAETIYFSTFADEGYSNGGDFGDIVNRAVNFGFGVTSQTVTVNLVDDAIAEGNERFSAIIQRNRLDPTSTFLDRSTFTINNDDGSSTAGNSVTVYLEPASVAFGPSAAGIAAPAFPSIATTVFPSIVEADRDFKDAIVGLAEKYDVPAAYLLAVMDFETGARFTPSIRNPVSGAVGLIQFTEAGISNLPPTSLMALENMTASEQMIWVERYFDRQIAPGSSPTVADFYMTVLWPAAVGKPDDYVLYSTGNIHYTQNIKLDFNNDGKIVKSEAAATVTSYTSRYLTQDPLEVFATAADKRLVVQSIDDRPNTFSISGQGGSVNVFAGGAATPIIVANGFRELSIVGGDFGDYVVLGDLSGTDISNNTIYFFGQDGNDVLSAEPANRAIYAEGGTGSDLIVGSRLSDNVFGGAGNDTVYGGDGNDIIYGGGYFDTVYGGGGDDRVYAGNGRDLVYLNEGNDIFVDNAQIGGWGQDTVFGGYGNDKIQGGGDNDVLLGQWGNDLIHGGLGHDKLYGGDEYDTLYGGGGNDTVDGGNGRDLVYLNDGNDLYIDNTQTGPMGNDTVFGGYGNDIVHGGGGDEVIHGQWGHDLIHGGLGNDIIYGGDEFDTVYGGGGDDTIDAGNGRDLVYLNDGNDLYIDNAQAGDLGRDTVFGGYGDDTIQGGSGNDVFHGQWGNDRVLAGTGDDTIYGGDQFDFIDAGAGNDLVNGGNGRDTILLGSGNDVYVDTAQTGALGQDTITGGAGADRYEFQAVMSSDVIRDFQVGIDVLQLTQSLWGGGLSETQVVSTYASVIGAGVLFEFGAGQSILLEGLNSSSGLEGDLLLV